MKSHEIVLSVVGLFLIFITIAFVFRSASKINQKRERARQQAAAQLSHQCATFEWGSEPPRAKSARNRRINSHGGTSTQSFPNSSNPSPHKSCCLFYCAADFQVCYFSLFHISETVGSLCQCSLPTQISLFQFFPVFCLSFRRLWGWIFSVLSVE